MCGGLLSRFDYTSATSAGRSPPYAEDVAKGTGRLGRLGRLWVVGTVAYGALRVFLVATFIADYGLNVVAYAVVEIASSTFLGISTARLTSRWMRRRDADQAAASKGLVIAATCAYFAPDAYILAFAHRMPARLLVPVLILISLGVASAVAKLRRDHSGATSGSSRSHRPEASAARQ